MSHYKEDIREVLIKAVSDKATDLYVIAGLDLTVKKNGTFSSVGDRLTPNDCKDIVRDIYELANMEEQRSLKVDDDFSFGLNSIGRFRVNVFKQRGSWSAVIRLIQFGLPSAEEMNIPQKVLDFANEKNGLILVTGPAGGGKSTTLSCIINQINETKQKHIITLEDPIEFVYRHGNSIVTQREIGNDVESYEVAMRSVMRESTDVVLLGEMRDKETMEVAISAAEIGQLIFSTLHTIGAANTIDRVLDSFPPNQQQQIRLQLALTLKGVISQQLVPGVDGKLVPVFEIMRTNIAISNMIRDAR
ncbi:MAG: PilT/PilU family type 4a pilus ATPase, partial [Clostridiales bacterium]|nr:PilT/PilU family type 4a pilus ATPase [Clostridiales bacterium]